MDKSKGWLKLYRSIEDNWLWDEVPFSYGQAWIDMLIMANHTQTKVMFNKEPIILEVGSFITSVRKLSTRWGWSKDRVLRFMRILEKDNMITRNSDNRRTLITLVKYGDYQSRCDTNEDTDATRVRHACDTNTPQTINNELKNDMNDINNKKIHRHMYGTYKNVPFSDEELKTLKEECPNDWEEWIEKVSSWCASNGKRYKNGLATIRNWKQRDQSNQASTTKPSGKYAGISEITKQATMKTLENFNYADMEDFD